MKRVVGEPLEIWADLFKDGHDVLSAVLKWRREGQKIWAESPMTAVDGDRFVEDARAAGDDDADRYKLRDVYLSEREFDDLPEFDGF